MDGYLGRDNSFRDGVVLLTGTGIVPQDDMPNARDFAARMLTLGNSAWQTREETAQILRALAAAQP